VNKEFIENESRVVKMNDVSLEVVDQFLTFLYTGQLKDKERAEEGTSGENNDKTWAEEMLPGLAYISDKVSECDYRVF